MTNVHIHAEFGWSVEVTSEQAAAGRNAAREPGATHYTIWRALRDAGVPARGERRGSYPASQAATAIQCPAASL